MLHSFVDEVRAAVSSNVARLSGCASDGGRSPYGRADSHGAGARIVVAAGWLLVVLMAAERASGQATSDSVTRESHGRSGVFPSLGSAPETGLAVGATAIQLYRAGDVGIVSYRKLVTMVTQRGQWRLYGETEHWTRDTTWRLWSRLEGFRFPLRYYGIGRDADRTESELYTPSGVQWQGLAVRRLRPSLSGGLGMTAAFTRFSPFDTGGRLRRGEVLGARGGRVVTLLARGQWDSRDDVLAPRRGLFVQLGLGGASRRATGSGYDFGRALVDLRSFSPIGRGTVVAMHGMFESVGVGAPFDQYPALGSYQLARGFDRGRFRDRTLAAVEGELRQQLWGRFGATLFGGTAVIGPNLGSLSTQRPILSTGFGLRWRLFAQERANIRADFAFGGPERGLYLGLFEAF